jgi:hypothetical protein
MALFEKTKASTSAMSMTPPRKKKKLTKVKNDLPTTRKSLFGNKEITKSRSVDKLGNVTKSKRILNPDGSSKTRVVEKYKGLKGIFGKRVTTTTRRGTLDDDIMTTRRSRKKGLLPKTKTTSTDKLLQEKEVNKNFLYKLGSRGERKKLKSDIRSESEKFTPPKCLDSCVSNPLNKK